METTHTNCPNCSTSLKSGFFGSTEIIEPLISDFIKKYSGTESEAYCTKCSPSLLSKAKTTYSQLKKGLNNQMEGLVKFIPVVTLQSPHAWMYKVVAMVTAQSVTGTGVFSEFASSFTDLFGMQSGRYNSKLKGGEDLCKAQIRLSAVAIGANAIIATDIDYAEVGGDKGMLMVCMSGTAIKLENPDVIGEIYKEKFSEIDKIFVKLQNMDKYSHLITE